MILFSFIYWNQDTEKLYLFQTDSAEKKEYSNTKLPMMNKKVYLNYNTVWSQ